MIPRRDEEGNRELGPLLWRVERTDNHGDCSTTTTLDFVWIARWRIELSLTRGWTRTLP